MDNIIDHRVDSNIRREIESRNGTNKEYQGVKEQDSASRMYDVNEKANLDNILDETSKLSDVETIMTELMFEMDG